MDGVALVSPDIAEAKAVIAVSFKLSTHEIAQMDPAALQAVGAVVHFKLLALRGGIPIYDGTELKGAIDVSGAAPEQEDEVARHAIGA